ncbi:serine--tRNA ligase [Paenibacillus larvae]
MLDIRFIREKAQLLQEIADNKNISLSIYDLLKLDEERSRLLVHVESIRKQRNELAKQIPMLLVQKKNEEAEQCKAESKQLQTRLADSEQELRRVQSAFDEMMLLVPNIVSPDTPVGKSDADNVPVRYWEKPVKFPFEIQDHVVLGKNLDLFDLPRGVKMAGSRNYVLKGDGVLLHRAVQQLAIDLLLRKNFTLMDVPVLVREESLQNTGYFPLGREQTFSIRNEDKFLAGTSEVSLVSCFSGDIVDVTEPIRLAAATYCFRKEVGAAGKDVRGLYRVHQFAKVEQVVFCRNDRDESESVLQEITANAEELLQMLELPYRVVAVCTGDMSQKTYKQYDIETWMPSRGDYGETHSSSNLHDFQSRRSNIRYRDERGNLEYCHTLNNTAVASPRILIPLLENHQREDGSLYLPPALRPYMGGRKELRAPKFD